MLRPYRINNLKIGFIDPAELNSTLLWNPSMTWWLGLLLSLRPQSLACMQTFKTPTNHFLYSYHMCYWFPPFYRCKHQCFLLPLLLALMAEPQWFAQTWQPVTVFPSDLTSLCLQQAGFRNNFTTGGDKSLAQSMEDCGGGLHVQVSHHKMCLHYTWASQFWEPGESTALTSSVAKSLGWVLHLGEKANLN